MVSCHLRRTGGSRLLITRPSWSLFLPLLSLSLSLSLFLSLSLSPSSLSASLRLLLFYFPSLLPFRSTAKVSSPDADSPRCIHPRIPRIPPRLGSGESAAVRRRMNESGVED